ncbi:unnamed protein product [Camellia sinensis]
MGANGASRVNPNIGEWMKFFKIMKEDEPILPCLKKEQPKNRWDDEDVDENHVKDSWEDEEEIALHACPGLKVLAPYSSEDARGLLKAAIRDIDPIIFLENELLYGESFPISEEVLDSNFCLPIRKAKVERE